ncbi:MAG: hypothetical protein GY820_14135, partial [Gammaproteobacteria bacterium]|nr:hypothetical protein [Gammaproteobacteria bacterium]
MPRQLRIHYENATYHVMNRGRGRQTIFYNVDYYHLLIKTPRAKLDRIMRHINGVYTQRYNQLRQTDGSLFRGRYKAILIGSKKSDLLQP